MIRHTQGNLLAAPTEALVNTVNEVGVKAKGIAVCSARPFRDTFVSGVRDAAQWLQPSSPASATAKEQPRARS
jgi:hypothetical protein